MQKILVAYTTNAGTTADVAQTIGTALSAHGLHVEVRRLEDVTDIAPYAAVVVGAPMIMGWHRAALKFLKRHQLALSRVPVAYFFMAVSLTQTPETSVDGVPIDVDEFLAKAPANPERLRLKERYATVTNYLRPVLKAAPAIKPLRVGFFGGKLELRRLKLWQMLFVLLIVQAQPGGSFNRPFIRAWADSLAAALSSDQAG